MRRWGNSLRKAEMNGYVKRTEGEDDREMMMRQCIGEHEARTTIKWSFVSVREGMNGNGGGRTEDGRENKKNTQGRRSMHATRKGHDQLPQAALRSCVGVVSSTIVHIRSVSDLHRQDSNSSMHGKRRKRAQAPLSDR